MFLIVNLLKFQLAFVFQAKFQCKIIKHIFIYNKYLQLIFLHHIFYKHNQYFILFKKNPCKIKVIQRHSKIVKLYLTNHFTNDHFFSKFFVTNLKCFLFIYLMQLNSESFGFITFINI